MRDADVISVLPRGQPLGTRHDKSRPAPLVRRGAGRCVQEIYPRRSRSALCGANVTELATGAPALVR